MDIKTLIAKHEGERRDAYLDSRRIWTIGIGFNLERQGADAALAAAGVNRDVIWAAIEEAKRAGHGQKPGDHTVDLLTDAEVDALFQTDVTEAIAGARRLCPGYDAWPSTAQAVLVDLVYNVGESKLSTWKHTLGAFNARDWKGVGNNLLATQPWFNQVGRRAQENVNLMYGLAQGI